MSAPTHYAYSFEAMRDSSTKLQLPPSKDWRVRLTTTGYVDFVGVTFQAVPIPERFIQFNESNTSGTITAGAISSDTITAGAIAL
jgi:hypothetical protein